MKHKQDLFSPVACTICCSRIYGRGEDQDYYNTCLMVSTVVFVGFRYVALTAVVLWKLD